MHYHTESPQSACLISPWDTVLECRYQRLIGANQACIALEYYDIRYIEHTNDPIADTTP